MKYYLWVLGCAMNQSDAERIATVLELLGYKKTEEETEADLIVTVACSVRQTAIDRIYGKSKAWKKLKIKNSKLKLILTGCVLEKDKKKMAEIFDTILPIEEIGKISKILDNSEFHNSDLNENFKLKIDNLENEYFEILPKYNSTFRAYVPIMTGCNNFCSYCAVPYTRGREKSRSMDDIIEETRKLVKNGFKEVTFLGQNVNSYGANTKSQIPNNKNKFVELLEKLDKLPGDWRGYFYSNHPKDMSEDLINLMPTLKHFPAYIHFPLQSGSDRILKEMNRHYTQSEYLAKVAKLRKAMPDLTLTTDIIVGYPGETEADFAETLKVAHLAEYDMIFSAQYSPRPGSKSEKIEDDVPKEEKKSREKAVIAILAETAANHNRFMVDQTERVLVDESKKEKIYGRTRGYKVIEIKTDQPLQAGQFVEVKVESAGPWKLAGSLVK